MENKEAIAYSSSVNIVRPILAKYMNEWSNEMLCELAHEIDMAVSRRESEIIDFINSGHPEPFNDTGWSIELGDVRRFIKK